MQLFHPETMARRALGFAAMGVVPQDSVVRDALRLLDEAAPAGASAARGALQQLASGVLPAQVTCAAGHLEMREALAFADMDDEADVSVSAPRG